jgi:hypothetical protein
MSAADWYIALFSLGSGVGILGFWGAVVARGRGREVAAGRREIAFHVAAELVTGAVLIAGGVAILADAKSRESVVMSTLGLGLLLYSLIQSPGHYIVEKDRRMVATFAATWVFAIPAIVLRFAS